MQQRLTEAPPLPEEGGEVVQLSTFIAQPARPACTACAAVLQTAATTTCTHANDVTRDYLLWFAARADRRKCFDLTVTAPGRFPNNV